MKTKKTISVPLLLLTLLISCKQTDGCDPGQLKINEIQVVGTHNSYARPVDPIVLHFGDSIVTAVFTPMMEQMPEEQKKQFEEYHPNGLTMKEGLKYDHPPFDVQLNAGLRSLEIDIYHDPEGGRFSNPASYRFFESMGISNLTPYEKEGLEEPGFKVLHMADFDFRTHYTTLKKALTAVKEWSGIHPNHIPLYIMIEAKDSGFPVFPGSTEVLPFDEQAFNQLDEEILSVINREKIITPDDVRGNYPTLREAVLAKNWPLLKNARGKIIFLLLPSAGGIGDTECPYVVNRPNLENRVMFVQSQPEKSYGAFLLMDNAIVRQEEIRKYVSAGYLVRTRSDIETYEAKVNDYTRAEAAFSSGAQIVSTDFFQEGPNTYGNNYRIVLPGNQPARFNPVNTNQNCEATITWE
ncbi:MAG: phosphatidylinositol-specific phospholipase C1-like protein [Tannerellaceae bacterium]|nr:phosphatidylinositol-specific phospholipase C1-like protein [Tannerellaceae bacterium]